jgi:glycosyltransferase involved in cell wall biosynthesis
LRREFSLDCMTAPATLEPARPAIALSGLSIVLPCHNEAPNLAAVVRMASEAGRRWALEHEVIVVDDGSSDRTLTLATALAAHDPAVRVVVHPVNRGYGAALRSGIAAARLPWVLLTDADLQFDLAQLGGFVPPAADHDVIVGYRLQRQDPVGRILAARVWNALVRAVFRLGVRDVDCAFKLIRRKFLYDLPLESDGATISTELLLQLLRRQARLAELPVIHRPRTAGRQSGTNPRVVARALRELLALRARLGRPAELPEADVVEPDELLAGRETAAGGVGAVPLGGTESVSSASARVGAASLRPAGDERRAA